MSFDKPHAVPEEEQALSDIPSEPELTEDELDDGHEIDGADDASDDEEAVFYDEQVKPEYGILGLTLRELLLVGVWLVLFTVSFIPLSGRGPVTVWTTGITWILTIGVPTAAAFLIVLRRFSPDGIRRVGSLGIDQFASVAASVSVVAWAQLLWAQSSASMQSGIYMVSWQIIVGQLAALALVALTVVAPFIPRLREDFHGRRETLAHRNANPVRPVIARPRPVRDSRATGDSVVAPVAEGTPRDEASVAEDGQPAEETPDAEDGAEAEAEPDADEDDDMDRTRVIDRLDPAQLAAAGFAQSPPAPVAQPATADAAEAAPIAEPAAVERAVVEPAAASPAPSGATQGPAASEPQGTSHHAGDDDDDIGITAERTPADIGITAERTPAESLDSMPIEVLNTGAIDALQEIFVADGVTTPIAMLSTDTGTIKAEGDAGASDDEQSADGDDDGSAAPLRRDRANGPTRAELKTPGIPVHEPFWILAPTDREVLDEFGHVAFHIGPTDWTLVIEDRGGAYVVRHEDGRIGFLHDISDIRKG